MYAPLINWRSRDSIFIWPSYTLSGDGWFGSSTGFIRTKELISLRSGKLITWPSNCERAHCRACLLDSKVIYSFQTLKRVQVTWWIFVENTLNSLYVKVEGIVVGASAPIRWRAVNQNFYRAVSGRVSDEFQNSGPLGRDLWAGEPDWSVTIVVEVIYKYK